MNVDDALGWAADHKAITIGAAATVVLGALYLRHRARTRTASDTSGMTGATVNGAGDYLVPYSNTADPTGTDNGAAGLTSAITGLTTTLNGLGAQRPPTPPASTALDAHQQHAATVAHAQHIARTAPHLLSDHQKHLLHDEHVKHAAVKSRPPTTAPAPSGAHTGRTSTPGGAVSTGTRPPVRSPYPPALNRRRRLPPIKTPPPRLPEREPILSYPY